MPIRRVLLRHDRLRIAAGDLVESLGSSLGWKWVACWIPDKHLAVLEVRAVWDSGNAACRELREFTTRWKPHLGEGMLGRCWKSQRTSISYDLSGDMVLPRSLLAEKAGMKIGIWVPLAGARSFLGVMEFLGDDLHHLDKDESSLAESLGVEIGQHFESVTARTRDR